jgi:hypothetical protein
MPTGQSLDDVANREYERTGVKPAMSRGTVHGIPAVIAEQTLTDRASQNYPAVHITSWYISDSSRLAKIRWIILAHREDERDRIINDHSSAVHHIVNSLTFH